VCVSAAPTVLRMAFVILGIILGLLVSLGPLSALAAPVDWVTNWLVGVGGDMVTNAVARLGHVPQTSKLALTLSAVLGAMTPGLIALTMVVAARGAKAFRRGAAAVAVLIALVSFLLVPVPQAVLLLVLALIVGVLPSVFNGMFITVPMLTIATVLAVRYGVLLWHGESNEVTAGALKLTSISSVEMLNLWRLALTVAGLAPFFLAGWRALFNESFAAGDRKSGTH
jgi:hypothetical protein